MLGIFGKSKKENSIPEPPSPEGEVPVPPPAPGSSDMPDFPGDNSNNNDLPSLDTNLPDFPGANSAPSAPDDPLAPPSDNMPAPNAAQQSGVFDEEPKEVNQDLNMQDDLTIPPITHDDDSNDNEIFGSKPKTMNTQKEESEDKPTAQDFAPNKPIMHFGDQEDDEPGLEDVESEESSTPTQKEPFADTIKRGEDIFVKTMEFGILTRDLHEVQKNAKHARLIYAKIADLKSQEDTQHNKLQAVLEDAQRKLVDIEGKIFD